MAGPGHSGQTLFSKSLAVTKTNRLPACIVRIALTAKVDRVDALFREKPGPLALALFPKRLFLSFFFS
jgi:hypothetical protein